MIPVLLRTVNQAQRCMIFNFIKFNTVSNVM